MAQATKNKTVAFTRDTLDYVNFFNMGVRAQKAFFAPLTTIRWGYKKKTDDNVLAPAPSGPRTILVDINYIGRLLGFKDSDHLIADIRRAYKKMEEEAFGITTYNEFGEKRTTIDKDDVVLKLAGFDIKKNKAIFQINKPELFYCVSQSPKGFLKFAAKDIFTYTTKYSLWMTILLLCQKGRTLELQTASLKQFTGLDSLGYCKLNRNCDAWHEYGLSFVVDYVYCFSDDLDENKKRSKQEEKEMLDELLLKYNFTDLKEMSKAFYDIVSFNRTQVEEVWQKALGEVDRGSMFSIDQYENTVKYKGEERVEKKYFEKQKKSGEGYRIDKYRITFKRKKF